MRAKLGLDLEALDLPPSASVSIEDLPSEYRDAVRW